MSMNGTSPPRKRNLKRPARKLPKTPILTNQNLKALPGHPAAIPLRDGGRPVRLPLNRVVNLRRSRPASLLRNRAVNLRRSRPASHLRNRAVNLHRSRPASLLPIRQIQRTVIRPAPSRRAVCHRRATMSNALPVKAGATVAIVTRNAVVATVILLRMSPSVQRRSPADATALSMSMGRERLPREDAPPWAVPFVRLT